MSENVFEIASVSKKDYNIISDKGNYIFCVKELNIPKNKLTVITGDSGCGKSTLLNILGLLIDFDTSDENEIKYFAKNNNDIFCYKEKLYTDKRELESVRRNFSYLFQQAHLVDRWSVLENISLPAINKGISQVTIKRNIENILNEMGSSDLCDDKFLHTSPANLSGGQQQRFALVRAFISKPDIILADEPIASLDEKSAKCITKFLLKKSEKMSIVLALHEKDYKKFYNRDENIEEINILDSQIKRYGGIETKENKEK